MWASPRRCPHATTCTRSALEVTGHLGHWVGKGVASCPVYVQDRGPNDDRAALEGGPVIHNRLVLAMAIYEASSLVWGREVFIRYSPT